MVRQYGVIMKTTLVLGDQTAQNLKEMAHQEGRSMSSVVEEALALLFAKRRTTAEIPELPAFSGGVPRVDTADRNALFEAMES